MTIRTSWSSTIDRIRSWFRPTPVASSPAHIRPREAALDKQAEAAATSEGMAEAPKKPVVSAS